MTSTASTNSDQRRVARRAILSAVGVLAVLTLGAGHFACGNDRASPAADGGTFVSHPDAALPVDAQPLPDAAPLADAAILTDPAVWFAVPGRQGCPLFEARTVPDPFPQRKWNSCGVGCLVADAQLPIDTLSPGAERAQSGGAYMQGDTFISIDMGGFAASGTASQYLQQVFRLSDGATVSAAQIRDATTCLFGAPVDDAPLLYTPVDSASRVLFGRASSQPGTPATWQTSWLSTGLVSDRFSFDDGVGFAFGGVSVGVVRTPDAGAFTTVEALAAVNRTAARKNLLAWATQTPDGGAIRSFTADAGVAQLVTQGTTARAVALSDERIVWVSVTGLPDSPYTSAQFSWSPFATRPQDVVITQGPSIPAKTDLDHVSAGGDYAATIGCDGPSGAAVCKLFVVQFSSKKLWAIPMRPGGNLFDNLLAVAPSEIVLGEIDWPTTNGTLAQAIQRIVRLDVAHLDDLQSAW